ncbi:MAG TPA: rhodanese-like domain-containing protein [Vicinamibacterales bacterium]|jgi:rhodanese-related sulfurtransferase|nr:rhodanese-like domain-containing protein [Vicinamibacterales bacterium]
MPIKNVTVRDAHQKQAEGYTYVDVRSVPEFEMGHPAGAVNIPLLHHDARTGMMMPNREFLQVMHANFPPDAKLLMGCQVGGRSAQAAQLLAASGYSDISNVIGGFGGGRDPMTGAFVEGWAQASLPIDSSGEGSYEVLRAKASGGDR